MAHLSANPLVRRSDRIETLGLAALSMLAAVGLFAALIIGGSTYGTTVARTAHQSPRHTVSVVVTAPGDIRNPTVVSWTAADGRPMTARVSSSRSDTVGRVRTIWVDDAGRPVAPPVTGTDAALGAVSAVIVFVFLVAVIWFALALGIRHLTDRHRDREWEREWADLDIGTFT
ncbi:hypothetical protein SCNU_19492 [Gordonia neofelifaecis NRRL B-59395]|uniref:Transmembrane protein n=1 Tax=Gordonia neofelifaecis NRRL B-59395 TaxID=644548 RepID=F1YPP1_9ACTN|nr:hypothetical protein SCNU_19492 [Gordonia neofelifaecis NRRL B-59395]